jgi:two-component system, OmpR family, sensor histidine kinase VicK
MTFSPSERTEVLNGVENITNTILRFLSNAKNRISGWLDSIDPLVSIGVELSAKAAIDLKNRGVKVKHITEINKENIHHCKELMQVFDELRHLDGIKGNFLVSETEYLAIGVALHETKPVIKLVYSSIKTIVEQQQYIFDTLWKC